MAYTVKQLAKLSGVSVRTLHWYDEKGLLAAAYHGANGYRYYEEEQLLLLQQILFFKELGFSLKDIQKLLLQPDFDKVKALEEHRQFLTEEINRKSNLITTIDKTMSHLRGKETMKDKELYRGFDSSRKKEYEQYLVKGHGTAAEELLKQSHKSTAKWDEDEWDDVKNTGDQIYKELTDAINSDLAPECDEVQKIIHRHYEGQNRFYDLTKEVYIGLTDLYAQHPDFKKIFDVYHPKMIEYISKAIRHYAEKNL
jgi:MerR family transcriptional regulator, thiopeptide resistance regulator